MKRTVWSVVAAVAMAVLAMMPLWGQAPPPPPQGQQQGQQQDDADDDPSKGVARISLINGDVKIKQGDSGDETAGTINAPLLAGDRISTDAGSRAELQFDSANVIRLGPMTEVRMGDLAYRRYEVQLATGMIMIRVLRDNDAQFEVNTPSVSVRPTRRGSYRVTVFPDGSSEITVRSGETEVFTPRGSETVRSGKTLRARGTASDPEYQVVNEPAEDDFDRWNTNRDRELDRSISSRYVPSDVYGVESLDPYGSWVYDNPYGYVWVPRVSAGWAPYRVGRWSYVNYYGWTWMSGDPWGWAPYHWGNWYYGGRGWSWYPGAIGSRYYWRPALVSFFGWGGGGYGGGFNVGFNFGFGNMGWVPLAPYERYRPWYGRGRNINNVTIVNNTNITNIYRNARNFNNGRNGVTSVRAGDFGRGGINDRNFVRAGDRDLRNVGDVRGNVPFNPSSESRRFSDRSVNGRSFPRSDDSRPFFRAGNNNNAQPGGGQGNNARGGLGNGGQAPTFRGGAVDNATPAPGAGGGFRRAGDAPGNPGGTGNVGTDRGGVRRGLGESASPSPAPNSGGFRRAGDNPVAGPNSAPAAAPGRGWRTFNSGTDSINRGGVNGGVNNDARQEIQSPRNSNGGFRSFEGRSAPGNDARQQVESPRNGNGGFRRFEGNAPNSAPRSDVQTQRGGGFRGFEGNSQRSAPQQQTAPQGSITPRGNRGSFGGAPQNVTPMQGPRSFSGGNFSGSQGGNFGSQRQQPVQINPPMVRDRGNFGGGGGQRPQMSGGSFGSARPNGGGGSVFRGGGGGGGGGGGQRMGGGGGGGGQRMGGGGGGGNRGGRGR